MYALLGCILNKESVTNPLISIKRPQLIEVSESLVGSHFPLFLRSIIRSIIISVRNHSEALVLIIRFSCYSIVSIFAK